MNEGITEEKMNRVDNYEYHVVEFLKNPLKDKERDSGNHICVPRSWAKWCSPKEHLVKIWYPPQDSCNIEKKVENKENKSELWESFYCRLKYSTDSYASAKREVLEYNTRSIKDRTPIPATAENKTSKTTPSNIENEATAKSTEDALAWSVSLKSANTITLKRKTNDFDTSSHHKRSRENEPSESVDEVAGPSSQAIRSNKTLTHKKSNGYLCIQEAPVVKSNDINSTEQKQVITQNASTANYSLDPKLVAQIPILDKCCELIKELEKRLGFSLIRKVINKLLSLDSDDDNNDCGGDEDCYEDVSDDDIGLIDPVIKEVVPPKYNVNEPEDHNKNNELFKNKSPQSIRKVTPKLNATVSNGVDLTIVDDSGVDGERRKKENIYPLNKEVVSPKYNANNSVNRNRNNYKNDFLKTKSSKPIKKAPPKVDTMMRKDDPDYAGDDIERRKKKKGPLERRTNVFTSPQQKPFLLPPEYDANDSRWTLKYQEPAEGLVELMKYSGVYVNASRLMDCKKHAKCGDALCVMLLSEVFTESALSTCTLTGKQSAGLQETNVRPGLDAHARDVILDFVDDQEKEEKYRRRGDRSYRTLLMSNKLKAMRIKVNQETLELSTGK